MLVVFEVTADSPEALRAAEQVAVAKSAQDHQLSDTLIRYVAGKETHTQRFYRVGDYFSAVEVRPKPRSLSVTFHVAPNADRYWRDLMVQVVAAIRDSAAGVSVQLTSVVR